MCLCQELLNMWKYARHAGEDGTDGAYREGRRPPAQRWGCGAYPKAFSPSACCWHLAHLSPDGHRQKQNSRQIIWIINKPKNRKTHCDDDARGELCAEAVIQEPLKRCILLHDEDKLCRRDNIWTRVKENACTSIADMYKLSQGYFWFHQCLRRLQQPDWSYSRSSCRLPPYSTDHLRWGLWTWPAGEKKAVHHQLHARKSTQILRKKKNKKSVESAITNTLLPRVRPCEAPSASRRCRPRYCPQISGSQTAECCCNRCLCGNSTRILMRCLIYSKHHISVFTGAKINLFVANESLCTSL